MLLPSLCVMPASAAVTPGDIYNYELIKMGGGDGKSVLDRVTNELMRSAEVEDYIIEFSFSNVKQYITSGGATESCTKFYFRAVSNNSDLVEVGHKKINATPTDLSNDENEAVFGDGSVIISDSKSYLVLKVPEGTTNGGVAVISVWMSTTDPTCTTNALKKTFTIKVIDDSRDGEIDIKLKQGTIPLTSNNISIPCNGGYSTLNIDQIIGYDFSGGVNSTAEKQLTYYKWLVEAQGNAINITDPSDKPLSGTQTSIEANVGNKTIKINPVTPGDSTITITVTPDERYVNENQARKYDTMVITINVKVTDYVGNVSLKAQPDKKLYLIASNTSLGTAVPVDLAISDVKINSNGNDVLLTDAGNGITSFNLTFTETDNLKIDTEELARRGMTATATSIGSFSMDIPVNAENKYFIPVTLITKKDGSKNVLSYSTSFKVKVSWTDITTNTTYTRTTSSTSTPITFNLYDGSKEGEIYGFTITQVGVDKEKYPANGTSTSIADNASVLAYVDRYNNPKENLKFYVSEVLIYDKDNLSSDYLTPVDVYDLDVTSDSTGQKYIYPIVPGTFALNEWTNNNGKTFEVKPKAVTNSAKVTVTVTIKEDDGNGKEISKSKQRGFTVKVNNIGVLPEDEGDIVKVELVLGKESLSANRELFREFYLKNDTKDVMQIDISKVYVSDSSKSTANYMSELKNYEWQLEIVKETNDVDILNGIDPPKSDNATLNSNRNYGTKYIYMDDKYLDQTDSSKYMYAKKVLEKESAKPEKSFTFSTGWYPTIWTKSDNKGVTVKLTILPLTSEEEQTGKEPFTATFKIYTNEMGGQFLPVIDYEKETIRIVENRTFTVEDGNKIFADEFYTFLNDEVKLTGKPLYMYCLRAVADGASQTSEKWYPFYGSEMDISKYIPKNEKTEYRIAIRLSAATPNDNNNFSSGVRMPVIVPGRKTLDSTAKKQYAYENGKIMYKGSGEVKVDYRVGLADWDRDTLTSETGSGIQVSPLLNPLGNTVEIKLAADTQTDPAKPKFASVSFKVKVPKASKKPLVKDDGKKKFTGFTNKLSWSAGGVDQDKSKWNWTTCAKGAVIYANLKTAFPNLKMAEIDGNYYYLLYVKTNATAKAAESEIITVPIPVDKYE